MGMCFECMERSSMGSKISASEFCSHGYMAWWMHANCMNNDDASAFEMLYGRQPMARRISSKMPCRKRLTDDDVVQAIRHASSASIHPEKGVSMEKLRLLFFNACDAELDKIVSSLIDQGYADYTVDELHVAVL